MAVAVLIAGCASSRGIGTSGRELDPATLGVTAVDSDWPAQAWWSAYGDPALDRLVERALDANPSMATVEARIERLRAQAGIADSVGGLHVDGGTDITRQRFSERGLVPPPYAGTWQWISSLQLSGRYEFDFWGRNRAALAAALGRVRASRAEAAAARLSLAAAVVRTWYGLAAQLQARDIARLSLRQREESLNLVQQRVTAGLDTRVTLKQASSLVPLGRQQLEAIEERIELARNALAALTAGSRNDPSIAQAAPRMPASLRGDMRLQLERMPLDLLGRRPEVIAARERVRAGRRDVEVAQADFYPNVSIASVVGFSAVGLKNLGELGTRSLALGPALRLPVFDNGRLRSSLRAASADQDAATASYNQTLLDVIRDVSDQFVSIRSVQRQMAEQRMAQDDAETAYDLARQRYRAGLSPYLTVLTAETAVIDQRGAAAALQARAVDLDVQLQRALGGGYQDSQDNPNPTNKPSRETR